MKQVRQVTKSIALREQAIWTPGHLYTELCYREKNFVKAQEGRWEKLAIPYHGVLALVALPRPPETNSTAVAQSA